MLPRNMVGRRVSTLVAVSVDPGGLAIRRFPFKVPTVPSLILDTVPRQARYAAPLGEHLLTPSFLYVTTADV